MTYRFNTTSTAQDNIRMIRHVASRLGNDLRQSVMFVGGATTALLLTDTAVPDVRPTDDVDIVVDVVGYGAYDALSEQLRAHGFKEDTDGTPPIICR